MFGISPRGLAPNYHDVIVLSFVEVGLLKVTTYSDDPMWARHLELQVGVVGEGHELGVACPAQYTMIGAREVRYFEGEDLCAEVGSSSECHG